MTNVGCRKLLRARPPDFLWTGRSRVVGWASFLKQTVLDLSVPWSAQMRLKRSKWAILISGMFFFRLEPQHVGLPSWFPSKTTNHGVTHGSSRKMTKFEREAQGLQPPGHLCLGHALCSIGMQANHAETIGLSKSLEGNIQGIDKWIPVESLLTDSDSLQATLQVSVYLGSPRVTYRGTGVTWTMHSQVSSVNV